MSDLLLPLVDEEATQALGQRLGAALEPGDLIGLDGPLGAGKTTLVQGLARGLGVPEEVPVQSPTFTLINEYPGRLVLYHGDLYRLEREAELLELGLWELADAGGVLVVEWLSRFPRALPEPRLQIDLAFTDAGGRLLRARAPAGAARAQQLIDALR